VLGSVFGEYGMVFGGIYALAIIGSLNDSIRTDINESTIETSEESDFDLNYNDAFGNTLDHEQSVLNPATGSLMIGGMGGVDMEGNPYGSDLSDSFSMMNVDYIGPTFDSPHDDMFSSSFDDSFSSFGMNDDC